MKQNLYNLYELNHMFISPFRAAAKSTEKFYNSPLNPWFYTPVGRHVDAALTLFERITRKYHEKPKFGIRFTEVNGKKVPVKKMVSKTKAMCRLLHFKKEGNFKQEKILLIAPMSGHYATLLKGTIEGLLPFFDVYITDWLNARDVPLVKGEFSLDDYIDYIIEFSEYLKGDCHIMGVCQPAVPVAAAAAIMENEKNKYSPKSIILVGGPIDGRINPTMVNELADKKTIEWFEQNLITRVPMNYAGAGRRVYPGFLQLASFISLKPDEHLKKHKEYFNHLIQGDGESADKHEKFYDEYLTVMDLPAEFYLQTIKKVFQDFDLPKGHFDSRGRPANMSNIRKTALLALEGEKDDIAGVGQSKAALTLSTNLPESKKMYYLQKDVGHYGVFSGSKYKQFVVPKIIEFTQKIAK